MKHTIMVDVVSALALIVANHHAWVLTNDTIAFREDHELVARKVVLLDSFGNNLFRDSV
jgi:hypothetical protein